jgi:ABC-type glycerol-3-phosphate transport system substrate-binding protein
MKKRSGCKETCRILVLCIVLLLTGCGKSKSEESLGKGRYMESCIDVSKDTSIPYSHFTVIPEGVPEKEDNGLYIVTYDANIMKLQADGSWEKRKLKWLEDIQEDFMYVSLIEGEDGKEYAITYVYAEDSPIQQKAVIFRRNGDKAEKIELPVLNKIGPSLNGIDIEDYDRPSYLYVFKDGKILLGFDTYCAIYGADGKEIISYEDVYGRSAVVYNNKLYVINNVNELGIYSIENKGLEKTIDIRSINEGIEIYLQDCGGLTVNKEGAIYLQNNNGVFKLKPNQLTWTKEIDGSLNSMMLQTGITCQLELDSNGKIYNVRQNKNTFLYELYAYEYDESVPSIPENTLRVYAMEDLDGVKAAIMRFQNENPSIRIEYMTNSSNNSSTKEDLVKNLNTELLAGKGPDIIILDGLNIDSYIEKGVLLDITDEVNKLIENNDLFPSIGDNYEGEGIIYAIPSRISIPVISGNPKAIEATYSLDQLAKYAEKSDKKIFGGIHDFDYCELMYILYKQYLFTEDGQLDKTKIKPFFENIKTIYEHSYIIKEEAWADKANSLYNIKDNSAELGFSILSSIRDVQEALSLINRADNTFTLVNGVYIPKDIIGINSHTANKELAIDFLKEMLSEKSQAYDVEEGLSINEKTVPQNNITYNPYEAVGVAMYTYTDMDGVYKKAAINFPGKKEMEQYAALYENLKSNFSAEFVLDDKMTQALMKFLSDDKTLEETIESVETFLELYTKE